MSAGASPSRPLATPTADHRVLAALTLAAVIGSAWLGASRIGAIPTDTYSERATLREARGMVAGQGRFGIFEYTHYPNGPIYAVAAMTYMGLQPHQMRLFPVAVSALALGFLLWALLQRSADPLPRLWAVAACVLLALQPGISNWQGALHEHSYVVSLCFLAIGLGAWVPARRAWLFFPLGFVAGWAGYDWLPAQALAVVTVRWLHHARSGEVDGARAALLAAVDGVRFTSGVCLAILSHLFQLALFFGSMEEAVRDLAGSAAVRMGAESAEIINPEYAARVTGNETGTPEQAVANVFGEGFSMASPDPGRVLTVFFSRFVARDIQPWIVSLACLVAAGLAVLQLRARRVGVTVSASRRAGVVALALAGAAAAPIAWTLLMPHHAVFHAHFLHRHFLVGLALLLVMPVLLARPQDAAPPSDAPASASLRALAAYGAVPALTVFIYGYAVVALARDGS